MIKRYVAETGSVDIVRIISEADNIATSIICRAEMVAAFGKMIRTNTLSREEATSASENFQNHWVHYVRLQVNELVVARAAQLAWDLGLRGYDSVHLASALVWQESIGETVTFAVFDKRLWQAAKQQGLRPFPENLLNA